MSEAPDQKQPADSRVVLGTIATCAAALSVAFALTGFPFATDYSKSFDSGVFPDVLHERASAWEALHGDPHPSIAEIMADHGHPEIEGGVSPRTPGALLLQLPLLVIPESLLMPMVPWCAAHEQPTQLCDHSHTR